MNEQYYEKLLNIETTGEQLWDSKTVHHYHPYQATAYFALDTLFNFYNVKDTDFIVDFGCGKGRLIFYINHFFNANVTGIEMDNEFYKDCLNNKATYLKNHKKCDDKINFVCCLGQDYNISPKDNKFYFFNPFSVQIFRKIIENILASVDDFYRYIEIILYYPSEDYIYYLENNTPFILDNEVRLEYFYDFDNDERFLIYKLSY